MDATLQNSHFLKISARVGAQLMGLQVLTKPIKCNSGVKDSDYSFKKVERRSEILSGSDGDQNPQSWFWPVCVSVRWAVPVRHRCSLHQTVWAEPWPLPFDSYSVSECWWCVWAAPVPPAATDRTSAADWRTPTNTHTHTSPSNIHTCRPAPSGRFCVHSFSFCSVWNKIIKLL